MVFLPLLILMFGPVTKGPEQADVGAFNSKDSLHIEVLNYDQLKPLLHIDNDTTYLVNFWATWCKPCVQELPYFLRLDSMYQDAPFKLVLVSLDFRKDYLKRLQPFVTERNLEQFVLILDDKRSNYWIDDINPSWSGAIPATLVYRGSQRFFHERTFKDLNELNDIVKPIIKQKL
jgi:thiol-disulfide isomerase/thioredoxin